MPDVLNWKQILKTHRLFGELDAREIDALLRPGKSTEIVIETHDNPVIFKRGDVGESIYLIGEGEVKVELIKHDNTKLTVATFSKGDLFGEMAFLEDKPRSATVIADTKHRCVVRAFRAQPFKDLLVSHPNLEFKLTSQLSERLRKVTEDILQFKLGDIDEKFKLLNAKVEADCKIVDSAVKMTQTMFDATNKRVHELSTQAAAVVEAEKSRQATISKVISWGTVIATPLAIALGFLGISSFYDLHKKAEEVKVDADSVKGMENELRKRIASVSNAQREISSYRDFILPLYLRYLGIDKIFFTMLENNPEQATPQLNALFQYIMSLDEMAKDDKDEKAKGDKDEKVESSKFYSVTSVTKFYADTKKDFLQRVFTEIVSDLNYLRIPLRELLRHNVDVIKYSDRSIIYYFILLAYTLDGQSIDGDNAKIGELVKNMEQDQRRYPTKPLTDFGPKKIEEGLVTYYLRPKRKGGLTSDESALYDKMTAGPRKQAKKQAAELAKLWKRINQKTNP